MNEILAQTIKHIFTKSKGVLASDERPSSADKNLAKAGIPSGENSRKAYRDLFINTPGFEQYVSGMILSDETFWQNDFSEKPFRQTLLDKKIIPIIKLDEGMGTLPGYDKEKVTLGLDKLAENLPKYYDNGARAAKWRAAFEISQSTPSVEVVETNAYIFALYCLMCHKNNVVPIVEPEVIYRGTYSFTEGQRATQSILKITFDVLQKFKLDLSGVILKTSMVLPGKESEDNKTVTHKQVGKATIETLKMSLPRNLGGIIFLSGGQDPMQATYNLNSIAQANDTEWPMTFSFLRSIQGPATETWAGKTENINKAREVFLKKLELDSNASQGKLNEA